MTLQLAQPAVLADGLLRLPELGDADYLRHVLGQDHQTAEADLEQELMAKASALGIELPISRWCDSRDPITPADESVDPLGVHDHSVSSEPNETPIPPLISHASTHSTTMPAILTEVSSKRRSRSLLTFNHYEKYLSHVHPALDQPQFLWPNHDKTEWSEGMVIKLVARNSFKGLTRSLTSRLRRRRRLTQASLSPMPCICCREDFTGGSNNLHTLPCGHMYCRTCLGVMIAQSITDESKMPPRCCTQPIPGSTIKTVLPRDQQQLFLKAVVQYSTPWEARIFCPNLSCGEFIPPSGKVDPKHPFEALCKSCKTRVCVMCKRAAHQLGHDCPEDGELDAVLKMGENSGWRRCYKCRALVELTQGCTHITCRCKAQFCYICGAVWDPAVGCPNFCNGEEELERRRAEEEARLAELEAEKLAREKAAELEAAERREAEKRTRESGEFRALREAQEKELTKFADFEHRAREAMRVRHSDKKVALDERFSDLMEKMRDRHAKTEQHLEDRQVLAEIELQAGQEEKEKKVRLKLKYMEDYCRGAMEGKDPPHPKNHNNSSNKPKINASQNHDREMPRRRVTQKDLEQLRQQYCVRDFMERRHQSQINGLREKQAKSMEELVERHQREVQTLMDRRREEVEELAVEFANEEEALLHVFAERRARLETRWALAIEILRVEMENKSGLKYAGMPLPRWPRDRGTDDTNMSGMDVKADMDLDMEMAEAVLAVMEGIP